MQTSQAKFFFQPIFGLISLSAVWDGQAQEAPRPSLARQKAEATPIISKYNLKAGPVLLNFSAGLLTEFNDNVNLADGSINQRESDLLLTPQLGIDLRWPITKLNSLNFHSSLSYVKYLSHPELDRSSTLLSPDSQLSFDLFSGDFKINFHDQFSFQEDPATVGSLSNTSSFGRFTNIAGITALWDLHDLILSLGYDHVTLIAVGSKDQSPEEVEQFNRSTEQVSASASFDLAGNFGAGLEATLASTRYPDAPESDCSRITFGPFLNWQATNYTKFYLSFGGQLYSNDGPANSLETTLTPDGKLITRDSEPTNSGSDQTFYANLTITHRLNRFYNDQLSIGRDGQAGITSEQIETNFIRYSSSWVINPYVRLHSVFSFEDVEETTAQFTSKYQRLGANLSATYQVTSHLAASFNYQFTRRKADDPTQNYSQNRFGFSFNYQF